MVKELLTLSRPLIEAAEKLIYFHFGFTNSLRCLCQSPEGKILNFTDILIHTHTHTHTHTPLLLFIVVVQSLSCVRLFVTTWTAECQASLFFTISQSLLEKIHLWWRLNFWFTISILHVIKINPIFLSLRKPWVQGHGWSTIRAPCYTHCLNWAWQWPRGSRDQLPTYSRRSRAVSLGVSTLLIHFIFPCT